MIFCYCSSLFPQICVSKQKEDRGVPYKPGYITMLYYALPTRSLRTACNRSDAPQLDLKTTLGGRNRSRTTKVVSMMNSAVGQFELKKCMQTRFCLVLRLIAL